MRSFFFLLLAMCVIVSAPAPSWAIAPGSEAHYWVQSSAEGLDPLLRRVRIVTRDVEKVDGVAYQWWELSMEKADGGVLGVRVLSERVPLTGPEGYGRIIRYIYSPAPAECLEYVDAQSGRAILPELSLFEREYLPRAFEESRYSDGFANTGRLMGHVLVRSNVRPDFPTVDFSSPKVLRLRSDLIVGPHTNERDDRDESVPTEKRKNTPYLTEDYREMMNAGANYFHPDPENLVWIRKEPVYWTGAGVHPDDFYRSNFLMGRKYMDEPAVRFGWNEWVPGNVVSPDVYANSLTARVEHYERLNERQFHCANNENLGAFNAYYDTINSWDTYPWTTTYQMMGGAPALVFEGRYVRRGYGWNPETLLGEGLEGLTDEQQYDYFHSLMRGAARRFGGNWGTSVYPEGDVDMMVPAVIHAYNQGARFIWMWNDSNLPYRRCLKVVQGLTEYAKTHPRPARQETLRSAQAAVVIPKGYMLTCDGIVGMNREALTDEGASYGDIAAAAIFEGILLSRAGVEYDYVNDYPGLRNAGYKQLIYVRENGNVEHVPARKYKAQPDTLKLELRPKKGDSIASRAQSSADFSIPRAGNITVDGKMDDWADAQWMELAGPEHWFGDNVRVEIDLVIPEDAKPGIPQDYLGFTWDDINDSYRQKYLLEGYGGNQVVVTSVKPGSPADKAGLREGDVFRYINEKWIRWAFEVWGKVDEFKKAPGKTVHIKLQRNGVDNYGGDKDLSARFALAVDDKNLYIAGEVTDDYHQQTWYGSEFWRNDSVQIGFDPTLSRGWDYGEYGHEIGFALAQGKPVAWRWSGRRGQPVGEMKNVKLAIDRKDGKTVYEAAVPLSQLAPLALGMWPQCGINIAVNDSDDGKGRKSRIELVRGAMTTGKKLAQFKTFEFPTPANENAVSAAILWNRRSMKVGGAAELTIAVASAGARETTIVAMLESLDNPETKPVESKTTIAVTSEPVEHTLTATTLSQPGRYRLTMKVLSPDGSVAAEDSQPVYVYK